MATKKFTIECTMNDRWVDDFCSFLKSLENNGKIGHSSIIGFYADGDGDFRPKFNIGIDFNMTKGFESNKTPEILFDAG